MRYVIVILGIFAALIVIQYYHSVRSWEKERDTYVLKDSLLQRRVLDVRDSAGREISVYKVQTINMAQLLQSSSSENKKLKEDLKVAHANLKDVESSTTVASSTKDTARIRIDSFIYVKDTGIKKIPFFYSPDTFMTVTGISTFHVFDSGISLDSTQINVDIKNSCSITYYNESKFLRPEQIKLLIAQDNPHTITGKVQTYYLSPEKKWFQKVWIHAVTGGIITLLLMNSLK